MKKKYNELVVAYEELSKCNIQLGKTHENLVLRQEADKARAAELLIANKELAYQNKEKENRAAELLIANIELAYQNEEKEKRAAELIIANKELIYQNQEKENRAMELALVNQDLVREKNYHFRHIGDLENMMFFISHKIRQPVAGILGLTHIIEAEGNLTDLRKIVGYIKESAQSLDKFTREMSDFIVHKQSKE
ncbi:MAG TPA: histidine kinase dimerization/phospho-acceptor domain-containing protein [Bacteroidia bacterium]|jgi:signal transduction histidine kinase